MHTHQRKHTCASCQREYILDRSTRQCSNCFGCTGCEEYLCPYCGSLFTLQPPGHTRGRAEGRRGGSSN